MTCLIADMRKAKGIHKLEYLVTGKEMKLLDQNTSEYFKVPAEVLMEQAAGSFVRELFSLKKDMKRVLLLQGKVRIIPFINSLTTVMISGRTIQHMTDGGHTIPCRN